MANAQILIVEDDTHAAKNIQHKLENLEFSVAGIVSSGDDAIQKIHVTVPDLVLMDIRIVTGLKGAEVAQKIYFRFDIPVVYLTYEIDEKILEHIKKTESFGFIKQPFTEYELKAVIEMALLRHKREKTLRESENLYRTAIEHSNDGVSIAQDGRRIFVNKKMLEIFGYEKPEEIIGKPLSHIVHPDDQELNLDFGQRRLKGEHVPSRYEFRGLRKDGKEVLIEISSTRTIYRGNYILLAYLRDVTERNKAEQERKKLEAQLMQSGKMEAIGTLAGGIAHEFNNIMGIIASNAELALDDTLETDPVHWNLNEIHEACMRARDVVKQILTFSRQAEQQLKPIKINPIIRQSLKLLKSSLPATIKICENIPILSDSVNADPTHINQVLINLCTNAAHAMEENMGTLTVSLENTELSNEERSQSLGLVPGKYLKLSVTDTGHGMDPEIQKKIFNPYFTTKEIGKGTGIGLSIVHGIVVNHGGAISVISEPEIGTTFDVFLPIVTDKPESIKNPTKTPPKGSERILFVDDDEPITTAVKMVLDRLGYDIVAMTNPDKALEMFREQPEAFDLVITDLAMPQMTGVMLFKMLRDIRIDIPVILCTGYSDKLNDKKAKEMGINAFMLKPLVRQKLAETIRAVLDEEVDMGYDCKIQGFSKNKYAFTGIEAHS